MHIKSFLHQLSRIPISRKRLSSNQRQSSDQTKLNTTFNDAAGNQWKVKDQKILCNENVVSLFESRSSPQCQALLAGLSEFKIHLGHHVDKKIREQVDSLLQGLSQSQSTQLGSLMRKEVCQFSNNELWLNTISVNKAIDLFYAQPNKRMHTLLNGLKHRLVRIVRQDDQYSTHTRITQKATHAISQIDIPLSHYVSDATLRLESHS